LSEIGDYPGDGKPKPVSFPSPSLAGTDAGRLRVVDLKHFVEMKLASGMTAPHRLQDLADVVRLITVAKLPRELAATLDPYVRAKYEELWLTAALGAFTWTSPPSNISKALNISQVLSLPAAAGEPGQA
jgi:hypothetical protein